MDLEETVFQSSQFYLVMTSDSRHLPTFSLNTVVPMNFLKKFLIEKIDKPTEISLVLTHFPPPRMLLTASRGQARSDPRTKHSIQELTPRTGTQLSEKHTSKRLEITAELVLESRHSNMEYRYPSWHLNYYITCSHLYNLAKQSISVAFE